MRIIETTTADKIASIAGLTEAHWQEIARNKHLMVLKPDVARYNSLEAAGNLLSLYAYNDADEIIGYSVNILSNHLHYADLRVCANDVLYIAPEYRRSRLGLQLIDRTEEAAKAHGVHMMSWHAKEGTALAGILPRKGCQLQELIFTKEL